MAFSSKKLSAIFLVLTILFSSTTSNIACNTCNTCNTCRPTPKPACPPPPAAFCPRDTLKLGVCADLLGLVNLVVGSPPTSKCCAVLAGLADLEVALCLCTAIKANVLGINLNVPVALSVLISACQKTIPPGYKCE